MKPIRTDSKRSMSMVRSHPCAWSSSPGLKSAFSGVGRTLSAVLAGLDASAPAFTALQPPLDIDNQPSKLPVDATSNQTASPFQT